ncbi:23 kDa integral membrane protein-like [Contarinia nasturtii]|uniref:23 kDa integral membrane protein-like n=1 Tax=Contarinia nasturtii TaxID=265458 RepID=UPI0012D40D49|nr:23 kDa integral membrane protein-like [Contarinia nasturtii]
MIATGFIIREKFDEFDEFFDFTPYAVAMTVLGFGVFLIAFLGCYGAIKENTTVLLAYSSIMIVIVFIEICVVIAAFIKRSDLEDVVEKRLFDTLRNSSENPVYFASWHFLQTELNCCGVFSKNDWNGILPSNVIPGSCCQRSIDDETCTLEEATGTACKTVFIQLLNKNLITVALFALVVALLQMFAIVFSCCLYLVYRRRPQATKYSQSSSQNL